MSDTIERALEKQRQLQQRREQEAEQQVHTEDPAAPPAQGSAVDHQATYTPLGEQPAAKGPAAAPAPDVDDLLDEEPDVYVDIDLLERSGMVAPSENYTQIKEEYRYIKRPLLNNAFGEQSGNNNRSNLILVSSTFPGEGKTFTAINLAISMVLEQDRTVLLVDADVINPSICSRLNIEPHPGLLDYLAGEASVSDIILSTNIPRLKVVTAGTRHHHSNEMLASEKMKQFMYELSTRYSDRIVVFDSAPVLGASETNVLAQMTGQAVLVVEEERTTHSQLERAISMLPPSTSTGLVLNKSKSSRREYYGYYYASDK